MASSEKTFLRSKLKWDEMKKKPHAEMLNWYRRLICLRKQTSALSNGCRDQVDVRYDKIKQWMLIERKPIYIALNISDIDLKIPIRFQNSAAILLASSKGIELHPESLELRPESVVIIASG